MAIRFLIRGLTKELICWIEIYPLDSATQRLNNQGLVL